MKSLILTLRLRMVRPAMAEPYAQSNHPGTERGHGAAARSAPRWPVVAGDTLWQSILTKGVDQSSLYVRPGLGSASRQRDVKARVVIKYSQRVTAPRGSVSKREMTLKIHLPKQIGSFMLKSRQRQRSRLA